MQNGRVGQLQIQSMSQQQQQSLKILQLSTLELAALVQNEYTENPLCEIESPWTGYELSHPMRASLSGRSARMYDDELPQQEPAVPSFENDWRQSVRDQLYDGSGADTSLAERITVLLDRHGFCACTDEELSLALRAAPEACARARRQLMQLEPGGIGCENTGSYLLFQLRRQSGETPEALERLVLQHLDWLEKRPFSQIAKELGTTTANVRVWCRRISELQPFPISEEENSAGILPDLLVEKEQDGYVARLMDDSTWTPRLSDLYGTYLRSASTEAETAYIRENVRRVRWLVTAIQQRKNTVLMLGRLIAEWQTRFFDGGELCALTQAAAADALQIHRSTVGRAVAGKYLTCRRGTFPMKMFFSTGIATPERRDSSGNLGREAVKEILCSLIKQENPDRPYSDDMLCRLLKKQGIEIARRTIAKYRVECGIRSTSERKRC